MIAKNLKFGVFLGPHHSLDENPTLAIERDLELAEILDKLDYDEIWVGEHHSGGFGTFLFFANNFAPWEATKHSYELAARYVFPYFQNTNSLREKSFTKAKIQHQKLQSDYMNAVETASMNYQNSKT